MTKLVWSYSMLETFEQCPLKFYDKHILKHKEPESEEAKYGMFIHENCERYISKRQDFLPEELQRNKPLIESVRHKFNGRSKAELKMGVTNTLAPADFFGRDVWGRGVADVSLVYDSPEACVLDWKTGKVREKEDQLRIMALMTMALYPHIETVKAANIWLKDNKLGEVYTFKRADQQTLWLDIIKRLDKMYAAIGTDQAAEAKPSFVCSFCPVKSCKWNKS